jgi:hypothetical protein
MAMAARQTAAASKGGGRPCFQSRPTVVVCILAVTQQKQTTINYSVLVHAALGGGWPRWQLSMVLYSNPAISARGQSERVLAGSNGDSGIQLRLDNGGARLLAGGRLAVVTAELLGLRWH